MRIDVNNRHEGNRTELFCFRVVCSCFCFGKSENDTLFSSVDLNYYVFGIVHMTGVQRFDSGLD